MWHPIEVANGAARGAVLGPLFLQFHQSWLGHDNETPAFNFALFIMKDEILDRGCWQWCVLWFWSADRVRVPAGLAGQPKATLLRAYLELALGILKCVSYIFHIRSSI